MSRMLVLDGDVTREMIRERRALGQDRHDEVWDGIYIMPPLPTNLHQSLVQRNAVIVQSVVPEDAVVQPGANVSDRRKNWKKNYRVPDVLVVLKHGRAVDCGTHWYGGPDLLIEITSPGEDIFEKLPFYAGIQVREVLILHQNSREVQLFRLHGDELLAVDPTTWEKQEWLKSEVLPLAYRRMQVRGSGPRVMVRRTDGEDGEWYV